MRYNEDILILTDLKKAGFSFVEVVREPREGWLERVDSLRADGIRHADGGNE